MKRALIVAATGGFLNGFLIPDMKLLQEMGYEVHCAANGNSVSTFVPEERFASIGVTFHQIDFSSTSPVSKESLTAYVLIVCYRDAAIIASIGNIPAIRHLL